MSRQAKAPGSGLNLLPGANTLRNEYVKEYDKNLITIAGHLAKAQGATVVDTQHVDEAKTSVIRVCSCIVPWWKRPEFFATLGGVCALLVGLPGFLAIFSPITEWSECQKFIGTIWFLVFFIVAIVLWFNSLFVQSKK